MKSANIQACRLKWRAPVNQWHEFPNGRAEMPAAVRAFRCGPWRALYEVAAYSGFWQLGRTTLEDICKVLDIPIPDGCDLMGLLWGMVKHITDKPEDQVLDILYHRLAHMHSANLFAQEVMALDEALDVLEESDKRVVIQEQSSATSSAAATKSFKASSAAKARSVRESGLAGKPAPKKRAKKKEFFKETFGHTFDIGQPAAKRFAPPGGSIWRSLTGRQGWNGHFPPNPRISTAFGDGTTTCRAACSDALIRLWDQYLTKHGLDWAQCPYDFNL
jgi:hypothetical protein